jgi:hypothetical protein
MATVNMKCMGSLNGVKKSGSINIQFRNPDFAHEWSEIYKAIPGQRTEIDDMRSLGFARWIGLAKLGKMIKVTKALAKKIENTHAADPDSFEKLDKPKKDRTAKQIYSGKVELSILANWSDGYKYLVAGNTRLTAQMKIFGEGYVWQYNVPDELPRPGMKLFNKVNEKTAVFAFGRMNPPTTGHAKLIEKVMTVAKKEKGTPMIYPSKTEDNNKNPLTYKTKLEVLRDVFGNIINTDASIKTPFDVLEHLNKKKFSKVVFVVGSDRVVEFKRNMSKFVESDLDNIKEFSVVSAGDRDPDAEGVKGISGSKMREYVKKDKFKKFADGLMTKNSKLAEKVFEELHPRR